MTQSGAIVTGHADYLSIQESSSSAAVLETALGIAVGAPVREFAHLDGSRLTISINNYGSSVAARPLTYMGWPWRKTELAQTSVAALFDASIVHLQGLVKSECDAFQDAVHSYLQARTVAGSYEMKMLAAFHFLEWLDGSRTMSKDPVSASLYVTREEANSIIEVRNNLAHNRGGLRDTIVEQVAKLRRAAPMDRNRLLDGEATSGFANYLMTVLGDALVRTVGYEGQTQPYLPLSGSSVADA